jgi:hypothetical protein
MLRAHEKNAAWHVFSWQVRGCTRLASAKVLCFREGDSRAWKRSVGEPAEGSLPSLGGRWPLNLQPLTETTALLWRARPENGPPEVSLPLARARQ